MELHSQCYYLDSGLVMDVRYSEDTVDPETEEPIAAYIDPFDQESWFDPGIHGVCAVEFGFPDDWERTPWFYIPGLNIIKKCEGEHPLIEALMDHLDLECEDIEDKIEASGGLKDLVRRMDINRLGRRVKKMYQNGDLTLAQVQKIKDVFGHLSSDFE